MERGGEYRIKDMVVDGDGDSVIGALRLIVECACRGNFVGLCSSRFRLAPQKAHLPARSLRAQALD